MKTLLAFAVLIFLAACGAQPPLGHSEGPELLVPAAGRIAPAVAERGTVVEFEQYAGMVAVVSQPLFFETEGLPFKKFHVIPGTHVYEGQVLASLYTPTPRRHVADQEELIERMHRSHALATAEWEIEYELLYLRYVAQTRAAAQAFDEAAMDAAQRLYLDRGRMRLEHEQNAEWRRIEVQEAYARLDELREDLRDTDLLAPFDGVITYTAPLNFNASIDTTMRVMFITPADAPVIVELAFPENLPNRTRVQRVRAEIENQSFELEYIPLTPEQAAYNTLHNLARRTRFALPDGVVFPVGTGVRIFAYTVYLPDVLRIPAAAVVGTSMGAYVYRIEDGRAVAVHPVFGARTATFYEVLYGLEEGDELLVN